MVHQELIERYDGPAVLLVSGDLPHAHLHRWPLQHLLHRVAARYVLLQPVGVRARVRVRVRARAWGWLGLVLLQPVGVPVGSEKLLTRLDRAGCDEAKQRHTPG